MFLIPLGTNGFFPSYGRETMCFVIPHGKILIILDAGSGMFRFADPKFKKLLDEVEEIHLYLSHYHLDHTVGLYAAFTLFKGKRVKVFAPDGKQQFSDSLEVSNFPEKYVRNHPNFSWSMLKNGSIRFVSYQLSVREQNHRGEVSLAYRFAFPDGKTLAYVTDSEFSSESIAFVKGVDFLLHEHYFSGPKPMVGGHVSTAGAATIAKEAQVKKLLLVHHNPMYDEKELEKLFRAATEIFRPTILAKDFEKVDF